MYQMKLSLSLHSACLVMLVVCGPLCVCVQLLMFGPNQHFGDKALLSDDYRYRANAVARGHVTVLCASREDFTMVCNLNC